MNKSFNSSESAAKAAGLSLRHFRRVAGQLNLKPQIIKGGKHNRARFFYTEAQIEIVKLRNETDGTQGTAKKAG